MASDRENSHARMKWSNAEVRQLAIALAEKCGCRTWKAHRGVAIWRFEERERLKTATR